VKLTHVEEWNPVARSQNPASLSFFAFWILTSEFYILLFIMETVLIFGQDL
jgi:hypothetical protein